MDTIGRSTAGTKQARGRDRGVDRGIPYNALPSQERFHRSEARFKAFCGPVGTGKSQALCQEALKLAFLNAGRLGLIGAPTFPMLRDATQRQFFEICDRAGLRYDWNRSENKVRLAIGRAEILFRSLENFERLRGPNLAWFGIDELTYTEPDAWLRLEARLRDPRAKHLCGFGVFTPKGFDWVYQKFASRKTEGYDLIQAAPRENCYVLNSVPDFYERLQRSYDPLFYEQEVLGKFLNIRQGRAYYAFSREESIREGQYDPARPLHWAWDFNLTPMCSVISQRFEDEVQVLDEIVLRTSSTPEVCREFMARWGSHKGKLFIYGDASGAAGNTASGRSDYQVIREFFRNAETMEIHYRVPAANPPVRERINTVNGRLLNARGERQLFIDPQCQELILDLEQVTYKAGSTQIDKESDPARTHASDALGYYLMQEFREPVGEKDRPLL